ncbi:MULTISPECIES: hypothetical protein [Mumia]|uniref:hypothetical protein n=1 Tax=Mumia TaxID=1546255 RepID=UPI00141F183D|nr:MULTISPECIES: hypothetical protein [unclassified Mumia]QMW67415.1 hypothetical protein H4N58_05795 [Mumia sp. ZJ1417]
MGHTAPAPTLRIKVAVVIVAVEALALIAFGVLDLLDLHADRVVLAIGTSLFFFGYAGLQLVAARALWHLAGWGRGALAFTQLIQLGLAWNLREANPPVALVFAIAAGAVMWCMFSRSTHRLFSELDAQARASQQ